MNFLCNIITMTCLYDVPEALYHGLLYIFPRFLVVLICVVYLGDKYRSKYHRKRFLGSPLKKNDELSQLKDKHMQEFTNQNKIIYGSK